MNNVYIEDRKGVIYHFNKLSMQETIKQQTKLGKIKDEELDVQLSNTIEVFKDVFIKSNPSYDVSLFEEDIIEYNYELIGLENLIKLINVVLEKVFQSKGTNTNNYPFLQEIPD